MKPKETNTAPITPTEAHRSLVADIVNYDHEAGALLTWDDCAQFIADSEARACASLAMVAAESADRNVSLRLENDQLRAENKANQHELNEARNAERLARVQLDLARAERDQLRAEVEAANKHCDILKESNDRACAEVERLTNQRDNLLKPMREQAIARAENAEAELGKLQELHGCSQEMVVHWCAHAAERSQGLDQARSELATEREKVRALRDALTEIMENSSGWAESTAREALESAEGAK